jgi:hypothetical protein
LVIKPCHELTHRVDLHHSGDPSRFVVFEQDGGNYLVRLKATDPQCIVDDNSSPQQPRCESVSAGEAATRLAALNGGLLRRRLLQASRSLRTLTCGAEMAALLGSDGYSSEDGWCPRARLFLTTRGFWAPALLAA